MTTEEAAQTFLQFYYPEVKDLCKHFLTLISATLVFSIVFSEKIVDFTRASQLHKAGLLGVFLLLIVALGLCGLGLYYIFVAAEQAAGSVVLDYGGDFRVFARRSYLLLDLSGLCYGLGMLGLVLIAASRIFDSHG